MNCRRFRQGWFPWPLVLALLGGCQHFNQGKPLFTLPSFAEESSSRLNPSQVADIQIGMGRSLEARGEVSQAMAAYSDALAKDPKRADAFVRLAVLADGLGKFPQAVEWYHQALKLQPANPNIYCDLGYSLYLQKEWDGAETNLRQAIELAPDHQRAHNNLGLVLARTGRADEALVEFRKGGCSRAAAHSNLAFVLATQGSWPEARRHYQLALQEEPSSVPAKKGLREVTGLMAKADTGGLGSTSLATPAAPAAQTSLEGPAAGARGAMPEDTLEHSDPFPGVFQIPGDREMVSRALPPAPLPIWCAPTGWGGPTLATAYP